MLVQWCRHLPWAKETLKTTKLKSHRFTNLRHSALSESRTMILSPKATDRPRLRVAALPTRSVKQSAVFYPNQLILIKQLMRMMFLTWSTFWTSSIIIMTWLWSYLTSQRLWSSWMRPPMLLIRQVPQPKPPLPSRTTRSLSARQRANSVVLASKLKWNLRWSKWWLILKWKKSLTNPARNLKNSSSRKMKTSKSSRRSTPRLSTRPIRRWSRSIRFRSPLPASRRTRRRNRLWRSNKKKHSKRSKKTWQRRVSQARTRSRRGLMNWPNRSLLTLLDSWRLCWKRKR